MSPRYFVLLSMVFAGCGDLPQPIIQSTSPDQPAEAGPPEVTVVASDFAIGNAPVEVELAGLEWLQETPDELTENTDSDAVDGVFEVDTSDGEGDSEDEQAGADDANPDEEPRLEEPVRSERPLDERLTPNAGGPTLNIGSSATLVWQGFRHEWEERPHRMGDFSNFVTTEAAHLEFGEGRTIEGIREWRFLPGQDGDHGPANTYLAAVHESRARFYSADWTIEFTDQVSDTPQQRAVTRVTQQVAFGLQRVPTRGETVEVFLQGFEMDITNPDTGETGYMWPTDFELGISDCVYTADDVVCYLNLKVEREDSPDPFKRAEESLDYRFDVFATAMIAPASAVAVRGFSASITGRDITLDPISRRSTITGQPGYESALVGVTGFEFELDSDRDRDGRYFESYHFAVRELHYDADTGEQEIRVKLGLKNDGTITYDATYDARIELSFVQFDLPNRDADTIIIGGTVCTERGWSPGVRCDEEVVSEREEVEMVF